MIDELSRRSLVPLWFVDFSQPLDESHVWWQVYLDNFMATEVSHEGPTRGPERELHGRAVRSWDDSGLLCSAEKHVFEASTSTGLKLMEI